MTQKEATKTLVDAVVDKLDDKDIKAFLEAHSEDDIAKFSHKVGGTIAYRILLRRMTGK